MEVSRTRARLRARDWGPAGPPACPPCFKKQAGSFSRPPGLLTPAPAALAYASGALAALEDQARRGELIWLYADETLLWRFALPRAGWGHRQAPRSRLPTRPLTPRQLQREAARKGAAGRRDRSGSRSTSGGLLSIIGAGQYGTAKVFYKIVPHFDAEGFRHYLHQVRATFSKTGKEVVMVVARSGLHRAHTLASTLAHWQGCFRLPCWPARCGHHLTPIEGFWRVLKDKRGAGRCFPDLQQLYWRVRRVCMAPHEPPIYPTFRTEALILVHF
jgi:DDE superfamily endonuclease